MHTNNLRDFASDIEHGRHTLSTLLGRHGANILPAAMASIAYVAIVMAVIAGALPWPTLLVLRSARATQPSSTKRGYAAFSRTWSLAWR